MKTAVFFSKLGRKLADLEDKSLAAYLLELSRLVSQDQLSKIPKFIAEMMQADAAWFVSDKQAPNSKIHSVLTTDIFCLGRFEVNAFSDNDTVIATKISQHLADDLRRIKEYHTIVRDAQTGFWSRELFFDFLSQEFARSRRYQAPMSLILADIDGYSKISNTGIVLEKTAHRIKIEVRGGDFLARIAENTFAIILPMTTLLQATESAERIMSKFKHLPILVHEVPLQVHLSIGISSLNFENESPHEIIIQADKALQAAKRLGGNQIVVFDVRGKRKP